MSGRRWLIGASAAAMVASLLVATASWVLDSRGHTRAHVVRGPGGVETTPERAPGSIDDGDADVRVEIGFAESGLARTVVRLRVLDPLTGERFADVDSEGVSRFHVPRGDAARTIGAQFLEMADGGEVVAGESELRVEPEVRHLFALTERGGARPRSESAWVQLVDDWGFPRPDFDLRWRDDGALLDRVGSWYRVPPGEREVAVCSAADPVRCVEVLRPARAGPVFVPVLADAERPAEITLSMGRADPRRRCWIVSKDRARPTAAGSAPSPVASMRVPPGTIDVFTAGDDGRARAEFHLQPGERADAALVRVPETHRVAIRCPGGPRAGRRVRAVCLDTGPRFLPPGVYRASGFADVGGVAAFRLWFEQLADADGTTTLDLFAGRWLVQEWSGDAPSADLVITVPDGAAQGPVGVRELQPYDGAVVLRARPGRRRGRLAAAYLRAGLPHASAVLEPSADEVRIAGLPAGVGAVVIEVPARSPDGRGTGWRPADLIDVIVRRGQTTVVEIGD